MNDLPMISVVIPVRDDAVRLAACLDSLRANDYPADRFEIIVLDNGSRDNSAEVARARGARVTVVPGPKVSELRNRGAAMASGEILGFADADHVLGTGWLTAAARALAAPDTAAAGSPPVPPTPGTWVQRTYDLMRPHPDRPVPASWLGAGNLVVRKGVFEEAGGFDTSLETCEDVELCQKVTARGLRIVNDPALYSVHLGDPRTLRAVFAGERWRGRDNLRVSLRVRPALRDLPSILFPAVTLAAVAALVVLALVPGVPWTALVGCACVPVGLACLRGAAMARRSRTPGRALPPAVAVAFAYEMGRATALAWRGKHSARQRMNDENGAPVHVAGGRRAVSGERRAG